jgi:hypothetical protein
MSLDVVPIPTHIRAQLAVSSDFVLIALNSWRETAAATNELVQHNFARMKHVSAEERAFLGWEIVTAAVEVSEIVGTVLLHMRNRHAAPFHAADNQTLKALFEQFRTDSVSDAEAWTLLRLRVPPGFSARAIGVARVQTKLVRTIQLAVTESARFWWTHSENARWWRHLPMSLTFEESFVVAPVAGPDRDAVVAEMAATPERVETLARMDEQKHEFEHTALRLGDVRVGRGLASAGSQLVINIIANMTPTAMAPSEKRWLFPFLTRDLTLAEKKVLADDGNYILG